MSEILLAVTAIAILFAGIYTLRQRDDDMKNQRELWEQERQNWAAERQQLLDRIQAPSFSEMKQAEVKVIKAQQGIKEPPPLEPL